MTVTEPTPDITPALPPVRTRALIVGTGFSGLGMAIALQRRGIDFLMLEKAADIGGTWRDNSYPGCACDIPSHLYSFSFEPKADWRHLFSYQGEIQEYLQGITAKYGLRRYIEFDSHVDRAHWDESEHRWHVFTVDGREYVTQFLISCAGALHIPSIPEFPGRDQFAGPAFHSAAWDHGVDLTGKRVAVIGTGASAIQIVPEIVDQVAQLQLYQRTPPWVVPRTNDELPPKLRRALENIPGLRLALRGGIYGLQEALAVGMTQYPPLLRIGHLLGKWNINRSIKDRRLRAKLTPDYRLGCKRILNSSSYYQALADPKTDVVTESIDRITADGIVTADGKERKVDVIVYATGFHVSDSYKYVELKGLNGEDIVDRFNREGPMAHRGTAVADLPNAYLLLGPNTGLGHNSMVYMIESQIRYVVEAIKAADRAGAEALAPTREAQDRYNAGLQAKLGRSVWNTGGCRSWYLDEHGKNRVLWGGFTWQYRLATRKLNPAEYRFWG